MYNVFLIGNIASGKSTAARYLESRGAQRIDLDMVAKDLYVPGSDLVLALADTFGSDILDDEGLIRKSLLAERAFISSEQTAKLNALVHPLVKQQLISMLLPAQSCAGDARCASLTVVEVSTPSAFSDIFTLADEVIAISAPLDVRRERAIERGMDPDDFDARCGVQPTEDELCSMATKVIDNAQNDDSMFLGLDSWIAEHALLEEGSGASRLAFDLDLNHA